MIAVVVLACAAARLCATTYYVDYVGGTDTNSGTAVSNAWKHCPGDPAAGGNAANTTITPGDVIRFKGGVTYELTGGGGIALLWDGVVGQPIIYDGNRDGTWGSGRARFTDNHNESGIAAFSATTLRRHLVFTTLEIGPMGGAPALPADPGSAVPPRFGGGIALTGGVENAVVEHCVFRELGYWFNQRPMGAASISGAGIAAGNSRQFRVSECTFSRVGTGCDFSAATHLGEVAISKCSFGESIMTPLEAPAALLAGVKITQCEIASESKFAREVWSGYGEAPRTTVQIVATDETVTWTVAAIGTPAPTFQWRKNGVALPGATSATLRLARTSAADAGIYTAVATNAAGSTVSNAALLVVLPRFLVSGLNKLRLFPSIPTPETPPVTNIAPEFAQHPVDQAVAPLASATFSAVATGTPLPGYQWRKNGVAIAGATAATLAFTEVSENDVGAYSVVATNAAGSVMSQVAQLTLLSTPTFTVQPADQLAVALASVTLSATAVSSPPPAYQWWKNGSLLTGATASALTLPSLSSDDAGSYHVVATNSAGSSTSRTATVTLLPSSSTPPPANSPEAVVPLVGQLVTVDEAPAELEFTVTGSEPRAVLVRAVGPTLAAFRLVGLLGDPLLEVYRDATRVGENDDWGGDTALRSAASVASIFPITDSLSKDSVLLLTLAPGTYRAVVSGKAGAQGLVWVDAYALP